MRRSSFFPPDKLITEGAKLSGGRDGTLVRADNVTNRVPGQLTVRPGFDETRMDDDSFLQYPVAMGSIGGELITVTSSALGNAYTWDGFRVSNGHVSQGTAVDLDSPALENDDYGQGDSLYSGYYQPTSVGIQVLRQASDTAFENAGIAAPAIGGAPTTTADATASARYGRRYVATLERTTSTNVLESAPSPDLLIYYSTSGVTQRFVLPPNLEVGDTLNIYQSERVSAGTLTDSQLHTVTAVPGRQMRLCHRRTITAADISAATITVSWSPDSAFSGRALYTGDDQEGITAQNDLPPVSDVVEAFSGSLFFANARAPRSLTFLGKAPYYSPRSSSGEGINAGTLSFTASSSTVGVTIDDADDFVPSEYVGLYLANNLTANADGYSTYTAMDLASYSAPNYSSGVAATATETEAAVFYLPIDFSWVTANGTSSSLNNVIAPSASGLLYDLAGTLNEALAATPIRALVFVDQNKVQQGGSSSMDNRYDVAEGAAGAEVSQRLNWVFYTVSNARSFTVTMRDAESGVAMPSGPITATTTGDYSFTEDGSTYDVGTYTFGVEPAVPGAVAWSKFELPEAVPPTNYEYPGKRGEPVIGMKASRDGMFVFKDSGIYKMTGNAQVGFSTRRVSNARLLHYTSCDTYNESVFAWTDQGVGRVTDAGFENLSRGEIGDLLQTRRDAVMADRTGLEKPPLVRANPDAHELVCVDDGATAYVYSFKTDSWTRWTDLPDIRHGIYTRELGMCWGSYWSTFTVDPLARTYVMQEAALPVGPTKYESSTEYEVGTEPGDIWTNTSGDSFVRDEDNVEFVAQTGSVSTIEKGPLVTVEFAPITLGDPGVYKRFTQGSILMESGNGVIIKQVLARDEDSGTYYTCEEDLDTSPEITSDLPYRYRFLIPRQVSYGYRMSIRVVLAGDGSGTFSLNGLELSGVIAGRHAKVD